MAKGEAPLMKSQMEFCCANCFYFRAKGTEIRCECRGRRIRWNPQGFLCSQYGTTATGGIDYPYTPTLDLFR